MLYAKMDDKARLELEQEMKQTKEKSWYRQLKIIDLSNQSYSVPTLADIFDLDPATIRSYIKRYNLDGLTGLAPDYGQGCPPKIEWTKEQWLELVHQPPSQFELLNTGAQNWTLALLKQYLQSCEAIEISQATISRQLKAHEINWRRARLKVTSPDPLYTIKRTRVKELQEKALSGTLSSDEAKEPPEESKKAHLVFFDSTDLHLCPDIGSGYQEQGKQHKVDSPGLENPWLALFGSLVYPSGEGVYTIHERKRHQEVQAHLQLLIDQEPDAFWFVISDNASAHKTPLLDEFYAQNKHRLEMVFLPTYSPHLNLIERLWRLMRGQVTRNNFFETLNALAKTVANWFEKLSFSQFCSLMGIDESVLGFV